VGFSKPSLVKKLLSFFSFYFAMISPVQGETEMPNTNDPQDTSKKKINYNYSWPVPTRKPKTEQKKDRPSALNEKSDKLRNKIERATV